MLVPNRNGVNAEDRIIVPNIASGKDGVGDHRSPEKLRECKGRVVKRLKTPQRIDKQPK